MRLVRTQADAAGFYGVPLTSPFTVVAVADAGCLPTAFQVFPPSTLDSTAYCVIGSPPSDVGAFHQTATRPFPRTTDRSRGTPATVAGVTTADFAEKAPAPTEFTAATRNT